MSRVDAKDFLKDVAKKRTTRGTTAFYIDLEILARFKRSCGDAPYVRVLEKFMTEFSDSMDALAKGKK